MNSSVLCSMLVSRMSLNSCGIFVTRQNIKIALEGWDIVSNMTFKVIFKKGENKYRFQSVFVVRVNDIISTLI